MGVESTKSILTEAYSITKKLHGHDPRTSHGMKYTLADVNTFKTYLRGLMEGMAEVDRKPFVQLAKNTRTALLENSMMQLPAYETFTLPLLRNFYPKLIAKELVNVMPIDKPEVVQAFIKPKFQLANQSGYNYNFPSVSQDISRGPSVGVSVSATANPNVTTNVLTVAGLDSDKSHVEKDFKITAILDKTGDAVTAVSISPTVDGVFSTAVTHSNGDTDVISGNIDFLTGNLVWSSQNNLTHKIRYQAYCSLEENKINPYTKFDVQKIRFTTIDRRLSSTWSMNMEQDAKALYDIQLQSELVNILGEQIAIDIDREIILDLLAVNTANNNNSTHVLTFSKTVPSNFLAGPKAWYENIIPVLNTLSAQIYNDSLMQSANTLACNPLDAAVFESLNSFNYLGDSTAGGDVGYRSATVGSGKWKLLVSSIIPSGRIIVKYRSEEMQRAAYVYAPYVPALLMPYPLGANPTMTVMSRYSKKAIRPEALGELTVTS